MNIDKIENKLKLNKKCIHVLDELKKLENTQKNVDRFISDEFQEREVNITTNILGKQEGEGCVHFTIPKVRSKEFFGRLNVLIGERAQELIEELNDIEKNI